MSITHTFKGPLPRPRPDFECEPLDASGIGDVERRLSLAERLANNDGMRRAVVLVLLLVAWGGLCLLARQPPPVSDLHSHPGDFRS